MSTKTLKKGETLFKEGDKITHLFFIQGGQVQAALIRKRPLELFSVTANSFLGEQALVGSLTHTFSAYALSEVKYVEIPVDLLKQQVEASQPLKLIVKSLAERYKLLLSEARSKRLESDSSPCPDDMVSKIFGSFFHSANQKAQKVQNDPKVTDANWEWEVDYFVLKNYAQRVFLESPKKIEQVSNILIKLKLALPVKGPNPDKPEEGEDVLVSLKLREMGLLQSFIEFYQYYYFKALKPDLLKVDDICFQIVSVFDDLGRSIEPDKKGLINLDYAQVLDQVQKTKGISIKSDHFSLLESKGVYLKRATNSEGKPILQFEKREIHYTLFFWKILKEIDKWNINGFVDLEEKETSPMQQNSEIKKCPACGAEANESQKFCSNCGEKIGIAKG